MLQVLQCDVALQAGPHNSATRAAVRWHPACHVRATQVNTKKSTVQRRCHMGATCCARCSSRHKTLDPRPGRPEPRPGNCKAHEDSTPERLVPRAYILWPRLQLPHNLDPRPYTLGPREGITMIWKRCRLFWIAPQALVFACFITVTEKPNSLLGILLLIPGRSTCLQTQCFS